MDFAIGYNKGEWKLYVTNDGCREELATFENGYEARLFLMTLADQTGMSNKKLHKYLKLVD